MFKARFTVQIVQSYRFIRILTLSTIIVLASTNYCFQRCFPASESDISDILKTQQCFESVAVIRKMNLRMFCLYWPGSDAALAQVGDAGLAVFVDATGYCQAEGGAFLLDQLHGARALKLICGAKGGMRRRVIGGGGRGRAETGDERVTGAKEASCCHTTLSSKWLWSGVPAWPSLTLSLSLSLCCSTSAGN